MPGAVVKGIIISISIIAALGIAVLENPQIQEWLEEQRRKIAELLRSLGEELDPESRRQAEAFAFEGKTPADDEGLRREAEGSRDAAAVATGRSLSSSSGTIRRIAVQGPSDPDEAEERRRKGREYLAKRNAQMLELQQKRKSLFLAGGSTTPTASTSFDGLVDENGTLKDPEKDAMKELPPVPIDNIVPEKLRVEMREVERQLAQPIPVSEVASSSGCHGFALGSRLANPFGDEYAIERSETPKPPLPPKIAMDEVVVDAPPMPGSYATQAQTAPAEAAIEDHSDLSYEEQLAIALSLSEAESSARGCSESQSAADDDDDAELKLAIEASLKEMREREAAQAKLPTQVAEQPLVDLTPPSPPLLPVRPQGRPDWAVVLDNQLSPPQTPASPSNATTSSDHDELYRLTPGLTRANLAAVDAQQQLAASTVTILPYDPVRAAAVSPEPPIMEASFYSAPSSASRRADSEEPHLIDAEDLPPRDDTRTPTLGFHTDAESEAEDDFTSLPGPTRSRSRSRPRSEVSNVEVIDVVEDSDADVLSEDGMPTPDSWTEVGSRDGESEMGDDTRMHL